MYKIRQLLSYQYLCLPTPISVLAAININTAPLPCTPTPQELHVRAQHLHSTVCEPAASGPTLQQPISATDHAQQKGGHTALNPAAMKFRHVSSHAENEMMQSMFFYLIPSYKLTTEIL